MEEILKKRRNTVAENYKNSNQQTSLIILSKENAIKSKKY